MKMTGWYDINDLSMERIVDDRAMTLVGRCSLTPS